MGIKFIHNSLSDYFAGEHLKQTVEDNSAWQTSLDTLVQDKDTYSRWRSVFGQLSELTSGEQVNELISWGERWQDGENIFGLDWLPRLYMGRERYDELSKILTDLDFIEKKCTAGMTYDLVEDYNRLGVGRGKPGPPIRTAWRHEGKLGVWCPFCLAWGKISEDQLGKVIKCPDCQMELRINSFVINAVWQPCDPKRIISEHKVSVTKLPQALSDFADLVRSEAHILKDYPNLTFQQAANQPNDVAPAQVALKRWNTGREKRPWFRLLNKQSGVKACLISFEDHYQKRQIRGPGKRRFPVYDFSPDGVLIVSESAEGKITVWDAYSGSEKKLTREELCFLQKNGLLETKYRRAAKAGRLRRIREFWGNYWFGLAGYNGELTTFDFAPGGGVVMGLQLVDTCELRLMPRRGRDKTLVELHTYLSISDCVFSPDAKLIVSAREGKLESWDTETGIKVATLAETSERISACSFSPDGLQVALGVGSEVQVIEAATGRLLGRVREHTSSVYACKFSPDSRRILTVSYDHNIKVWDLHVLYAIGRKMPQGLSRVTAATFDINGTKVLCGLSDGSLRLFDITTNSWSNILGPIFEGIRSCAFSPDGTKVAVGVSKRDQYGFKTIVKTIILDRKSGAELVALDNNVRILGRGVTCAFSPDGSFFAMSSDECVWLWDASTGGLIGFKEIGKGRYRIRRGVIWTFSSDGSSIILEGKDGEPMRWDLRTGRVKGIAGLLHSRDRITTFDISLDGFLILLGTRRDEMQKLILKSWNGLIFEKKKEFWQYGEVTACAISPDSSQIMSALDKYHNSRARDRYWLRLFDYKTKRSLAVLKGHSGIITNCWFSSDGLQVFSLSADNTLRAWDIKTSSELAIYCETKSRGYYAKSLSGHQLMVKASHGGLHILQLEGFTLQVPIITAARLWLFDKSRPDDKLTARCVWCGKRFEVKEDMLGEEVNCSRCGKPLKLNPFKAEPPPL